MAQADHLIVFAKAPLPGRAKTRLAAVLGEPAAAALAARMLEHTLAQAAAAGFGEVELCGSPDGHPLLAAAAARVGARLSGQGEGDLGQRMGRAFRRALADHPRVLMVGSDCPALGAAMLRQAADALVAPLDAVFRPTLDGGYVLIGLRRYRAELFQAIPWSGPEAMPVTRERMRRLCWRWWEGPALADVDEAADLVHVPPAWLAGP